MLPFAQAHPLLLTTGEHWAILASIAAVVGVGVSITRTRWNVMTEDRRKDITIALEKMKGDLVRDISRETKEVLNDFRDDIRRELNGLKGDVQKDISELREDLKEYARRDWVMSELERIKMDMTSHCDRRRAECELRRAGCPTIESDEG